MPGNLGQTNGRMAQRKGASLGLCLGWAVRITAFLNRNGSIVSKKARYTEGERRTGPVAIKLKKSAKLGCQADATISEEGLLSLIQEEKCQIPKDSETLRAILVMRRAGRGSVEWETVATPGAPDAKTSQVRPPHFPIIAQPQQMENCHSKWRIC